MSRVGRLLGAQGADAAGLAFDALQRARDEGIPSPRPLPHNWIGNPVTRTRGGAPSSRTVRRTRAPLA